MFLTANFATDLLAARLRACGYDLSRLSQDQFAEVNRLARSARSIAKETGLSHHTVAKAVSAKDAEGSGSVGEDKNSNGLDESAEIPHSAEDGLTSPGPVSRVDPRRS